jgi:hypothetical protein
MRRPVARLWRSHGPMGGPTQDEDEHEPSILAHERIDLYSWSLSTLLGTSKQTRPQGLAVLITCDAEAACMPGRQDLINAAPVDVEEIEAPAAYLMCSRGVGMCRK